MTKEKPLSSKRFGLAKNVPEAIMNDVFFYQEKDVAEAVKKLKEEALKDSRHIKEANMVSINCLFTQIDKIMGFNHSPQENKEFKSLRAEIGIKPEDTHAKDGWGHQKRYKEKKGCGESFEELDGDGEITVLECGERDVEGNIKLCPKCEKLKTEWEWSKEVGK